MIDLYMWSTTNSRRASVMLEEVGLDYTAHALNIHEGEQSTSEHTARNPYQKVPVIVDPDGPGGKPATVFESGAILLYLAEKTGKLYGDSPVERVEVQKWFIFQMNSTLPIFSFIRSYADIAKQAERICKVMDNHLGGQEFFAGAYSIADVALFPRIAEYSPNIFPVRDYANIARWIDTVAARPASARGMAQPPKP